MMLWCGVHTAVARALLTFGANMPLGMSVFSHGFSEVPVEDLELRLDRKLGTSSAVLDTCTGRHLRPEFLGKPAAAWPHGVRLFAI